MSLTKVSYSMIQGAPVNVLDFGASPSATATANAAAIQAAIDSLPSTGGTVYFPAGTYQKNASVSIDKSNVFLVGEPNAVISDTANGYTSVVFEADLTNIGISGLSFVGSTDSTQASNGYAVFVMENATKVRINDCSFSGYTGGVGLLVNITDAEISNCRFSEMTYIPALGIGGYGILGEACSDVRVLGNYFAETVERHHIYMSRNALNKTITSQRWVVSGNNFNSKSETTYLTGFEFACKVLATQDVTITGNTFSGGVGHVWLTSLDSSYTSEYPSRVTIDGNTFSNIAKGNSTAAACIGADASTIYNVIISNNTMNSCDVISHIRLTLGDNIKISGNIISSPVSGSGIESTNEISNLTIVNNHIDTAATFRGVNIGSAGGSGNSVGFVAQNNYIFNGAFGIIVRQADDAIIDSNNINSSDISIYVIGGNFAGTIRDNILENGNYGIDIPAAFTGFAWVYGNRFSSITQNINNRGTGWLVEPYGNVTASLGYQRKLAFNVANAAPSTGTWLAGDVCMSNAPASGTYIGYVCTANGTPGTWKAFGAIA